MEISSVRPRRLLACAALAAGTIALAACSSTPSTQRVALDLVDSFAEEDDVTDGQRQCLREKVAGYSNEDLELIGGDANGDGNVDDGEVVDVDFTDPNWRDDAPQALVAFVDDLQTCIG